MDGWAGPGILRTGSRPAICPPAAFCRSCRQQGDRRGQPDEEAGLRGSVDAGPSCHAALADGLRRARQGTGSESLLADRESFAQLEHDNPQGRSGGYSDAGGRHLSRGNWRGAAPGNARGAADPAGCRPGVLWSPADGRQRPAPAQPCNHRRRKLEGTRARRRHAGICRHGQRDDRRADCRVWTGREPIPRRCATGRQSRGRQRQHAVWEGARQEAPWMEETP